jgi:hypothetical protein
MENMELSEEENEIIKNISMDILNLLDGNPTRETLMALSFVLCETICNTAPDLASAMNAATALSLSLMQSISSYNEEGICRWNEEPFVQ